MVPKAAWEFRSLNKATSNNRYLVPHIQDFSIRLAGATVSAKVDLVRGYHQLPVHLAGVPKTAVITPFGPFEFLQMPLGLEATAQTFQRLVDSVLQGIIFWFI